MKINFQILQFNPIWLFVILAIYSRNSQNADPLENIAAIDFDQVQNSILLDFFFFSLRLLFSPSSKNRNDSTERNGYEMRVI